MQPFILSMPVWAIISLRFPSQEKGTVTTPMVIIPISLATLATTGAAPVPTPAPIPAVIKTKFAP